MQSLFEAQALVTPILVLATLFLSPLPQLIFSFCRKAQQSKSTEAHLSNGGIQGQDATQHGFIVPAQIHHARMTPRNAQHSFKYPSVYFAFELHALEKGELDCSTGFRWSARGKRAGWSATRLHPDDFGRKTFPDAASSRTIDLISTSLLYKLIYELRFRGYLSVGPQDIEEPNNFESDSMPWQKEVGQVWAIAMPSVFGLAGFNPLTVYYVYRPSHTREDERGPLWLAVLEVHNTFNERHIYICEVDKDEDRDQAGKPQRRKGYDHCWTFPREFHVSPFNDRLGYYQLFLRDMWDPRACSSLPTIDVRLLLLEPDEGTSGKASLHKKLLATLTSSQATSATQKPSRDAAGLCASSIMMMLLRQPFDLFLPVARIMWEAAILHWKRKLPVHIRPEPHGEAVSKRGLRSSAAWPTVHNPVEQITPTQASGDIYWNDETFLERACRKAIAKWLKQATQERPESSILIKSRNPESDDIYFACGEMLRVPKDRADNASLTIHTVSSALYVDLCIYVPVQALLFGSTVERGWTIDSSESFEVLTRPTVASDSAEKAVFRTNVAHYLRSSFMRWAVGETLKAKDDKRKDALGHDLIKAAGGHHPLDDVGYSTTLLLAMAMHILTVLLTAGASKLFHVHYIRRPWAQVGEGLAILCKSNKGIS